ncbi:hypothetical protein [Bdellovibrio bacteriovorus]|uniref:hypothetical protein n=1 Tax=Bdellovibrio bacteriovorus TaxID=959 RepID=UPI0035A71E1D
MAKILLLLLLICSGSVYAQYDNKWRITKPHWTTQDEERFAEFISYIGAAVNRRECGTVDSCLKNPLANPYAGTDPEELKLFADCADLPYYLRAYFAWKNGLPMSVQDDMAPREPNDKKDVRYTKFGNYVKSRYDIVAGRWRGINAVDVLNETIIDKTYTASFRVMGTEDRGLFTDFYPVKLGRDSIRPGTVIYDPNGHVAIIYRVSDDGRIYYIDSHPDNTLTSGMYTPKFVRSTPFQGAGFKNFRPLALVDAKLNSSGEYIGGRIVGAPNSSLPLFSIEQFYGNHPDPAGDWQKGQFLFHGMAFPYYDYLRLVMARGDLKIDPLVDMQQNLVDICTTLKDRVTAVSTAIKAGIDLKDHPERLPQNIYGTDGEWETYATPARDARLKVAFMDLLLQTKQLIARQRSGDPMIVYAGTNLPADMLQVYYREAGACQFSYANSAGALVPLNMEVARHRLFDLSFDPYHCVELRWGAANPQELATCLDTPVKREWYSRERWLRYQWERRYDARMDYSLEELDGPKPGAGIAAPPDVDVVRFLTYGR